MKNMNGSSDYSNEILCQDIFHCIRDVCNFFERNRKFELALANYKNGGDRVKPLDRFTNNGFPLQQMQILSILAMDSEKEQVKKELRESLTIKQEENHFYIPFLNGGRG